LLLSVTDDKPAYQGQSSPLTKVHDGCKAGAPIGACKGAHLLPNVLRVLDVLKSEPDCVFLILDVCDRTGIGYDTVKSILRRLASTGKGSGAVRRVEPGIYQYDPLKGSDSLQALAQSGNWHIENLVIMTHAPLGTHPIPVHPNETMPEQDKVHEKCIKGCIGCPERDTTCASIPISLPGYPWILPTSQKVTWEQHKNGTQRIALAANGAPPYSADHTLTLFDLFRKEGLVVENSECLSIELNKDDQRIRIDASYSLRVIEGLLLKIYQHGESARIEIADRRKVPLREVMEILHAVAGGIDTRETRREVKAMGERMHQFDKTLRYVSSIATKGRDNPKHSQQDPDPAKPIERQYEGFTTASQLPR
jgi:hypothetical protein